MLPYFRYILNGASVKLVLKQTSPEFRVVQPPGAPRVNIIITEAVFRPFFLHMAPELILKTENILSSGKSALVNFNKIHADSFTIAPGVSTHSTYRSFLE